MDAFIKAPSMSIEPSLAAAIRAAADQAVPEEPYCHEDDLFSDYTRRSERQQIRAELLAIAAELEGGPQTISGTH